MTAPPCPACAGRWLYGFTFDHRLDCRIRDAEDATRAADRDRISLHWPLTRPSTAAELELAAAFDPAAPTAETPTDQEKMPEGQQDKMPDPEQPDAEQDTDKPGAEAARYRRRLRETETERDGLAERLTTYQRRETERLAAEHLVRADDVWLGGTDVAAVLDDVGEVDPAEVIAVAKAVLEGRPQLGTAYRVRPRPDSAQGQGARSSGASWGDVLKGHA